MKNIVLSSLNANDVIDLEEMRKAARDWYQMENADQLPELVDRHQPALHRETHTQGIRWKASSFIIWKLYRQGSF
ncbi:hypothetical protein ACI2OX_08005 [Bacillus sp. N9]